MRKKDRVNYLKINIKHHKENTREDTVAAEEERKNQSYKCCRMCRK